MQYNQPTNNYERNFLLVKKFGSKFTVLLVPILLFINIICIGYISITKNELLEVTLFKLIVTKIKPTFEFHAFEGIFLTMSCLFSLFFIFAFMSFYFTSKDPSPDAVPEFSLSITYAWSMIQLLLYAVCFGGTAFFLILFTFKDVKNFAYFAEMLGINLVELKAYKISVILVLILICAIFALMIWFSQSQAQFVKSLKLTLTNSSRAKNNGAHTFGVFCMSASLALLFFAGGMTFLYHCYKNAFVGFGINMDKMYVFISMTMAYIRAIIPFLIAVFALSFSETVDAVNTSNMNYYESGGNDVLDPNMNRSKKYIIDDPKITKS